MSVRVHVHHCFQAALLLLVFSGASDAGAQGAERLPIIDVHLHALPADAQGPPPLGMCTPLAEYPAWDPRGDDYGAMFLARFKNPTCTDPVWSPETDEALMRETIAAMERLNMVGVLSGPRALVAQWTKAAPGRFMPGLLFDAAQPEVSPDSLRALAEAGKVAVLGEVINQYSGVAPDDERMAPYWAVAEQLDLPVGIHIGPGPPGAHYLGFAGYRAHLHSALTLEPVLVRHPKLRVYIMHAGFPMIDDLLALLYAHPQVYVDIGVIVFTQPAFHDFLRRIVEAGYGKRVLFGSDQMVWPGVIERSVAAIEGATYLTEQQKRDILYHNAARFLRLSEADIARHHGKRP